MSNKTLIIGDLHLGGGISIGKPASGFGLNSRILDQFEILNWVLGQAITKSVSRLIFTGDLFEELKPEHNIVVMFINWLRECSDNGVECHIIAGNHDLKRVGTKYSSVLDIIEASDIDNVHIYNHIYTLHTLDTSFTFIPFRDRRSLAAETCEEGIEKIKSHLSYELAEIPLDNNKVVVGHLAIEKSFYVDEIDDVSNELMIPVNFFSGYDYVWMGHVHNPQVMNKENPYVEHIGSMDLSDFGETKHTKILILFDNELPNKFEKIDIPSRPLRRIRLEVPKDKVATEFVLDDINNLNKKYPFTNAIVKLEIKILNPDADSLDREKIISRLNQLGTYHISSFSETKNITVVPASKMHVQNNAIKPKEAVKLISDIIEHETDEDKNYFVNICNQIIEEETT